MLTLTRQVLFRNAYYLLLREHFNDKIFTRIEINKEEVEKRELYKNICESYENDFYCTIGKLDFFYVSPLLTQYADLGIISLYPIEGWIQIGDGKIRSKFFEEKIKSKRIQKMSKLEIVINHLEFLFNQDFYIESIDRDKFQKQLKVTDWIQKDRKVIK